MTSHQPIILGITGGIACGKSEVGRVLTQNGFAVLDTDSLAHQVMKAGSPVFKKVVERFGVRVVGEDGELNRAVLGKIIFDDEAAREALNKMVHPAVIQAVETWIQSRIGDVAVMIPLLFEVGWTTGWDAIVCVTANEETVFQRLEKRGVDREAAQKRRAAQMPVAEKAARSNFKIVNNGSLEALCDQTVELVECIRNERNDDE